MYAERVSQTRSPLEARFLADCTTVGLLVEPNYPIGPIHADFAIVEEKIAIECDSVEFHGNKPGAATTDAERNKIYGTHGWTVLRIDGRTAKGISIQNRRLDIFLNAMRNCAERIIMNGMSGRT